MSAVKWRSSLLVRAILKEKHKDLSFVLPILRHTKSYTLSKLRWKALILDRHMSCVPVISFRSYPISFTLRHSKLGESALIKPNVELEASTRWRIQHAAANDPNRSHFPQSSELVFHVACLRDMQSYNKIYVPFASLLPKRCRIISQLPISNALNDTARCDERSKSISFTAFIGLVVHIKGEVREYI